MSNECEFMTKLTRLRKVSDVLNIPITPLIQ